MSAGGIGEDLIHAVKDHAAITKAAITGSRARSATDRFSDLDVLLVTNDLEAVRDVRAWLPNSKHILISAFHLTHYCTVLWNDFQKLDLAIFSLDDPPSQWVVHDYKIIKGGPDFEAQLAQSAQATREERALHLDPDISFDNILLLLVTAYHRAHRGELLSAHQFLATACDMVIALRARRDAVDTERDLLDPRRRLERTEPILAKTIHQSLFVRPQQGVVQLAQYLASFLRADLSANQLQVLTHLLEGG